MGDTQETASYVGKNFEYRSDPSYGVVRGRDAFLKRISHQRPSRHWPWPSMRLPGLFPDSWLRRLLMRVLVSFLSLLIKIIGGSLT